MDIIPSLLTVVWLYEPQVITITNDLGGNLKEYQLRASASALKGDYYIIDGVCGSACILYVPMACVTERAMLGFHSPSGGTEKGLEWARGVLAGAMPKKMARWYLQGPAYSEDVVWLGYKEVVHMGVRPCKNGE